MKSFAKSIKMNANEERDKAAKKGKRKKVQKERMKRNRKKKLLVSLQQIYVQLQIISYSSK